MHGSIPSTPAKPNFRSAERTISGEPPALGGIRGDLKPPQKKKQQLRQLQWAAELEEDQMSFHSRCFISSLTGCSSSSWSLRELMSAGDIILWFILGF